MQDRTRLPNIVLGTLIALFALLALLQPSWALFFSVVTVGTVRSIAVTGVVAGCRIVAVTGAVAVPAFGPDTVARTGKSWGDAPRNAHRRMLQLGTLIALLALLALLQPSWALFFSVRSKSAVRAITNMP